LKAGFPVKRNEASFTDFIIQYQQRDHKPAFASCKAGKEDSMKAFLVGLAVLVSFLIIALVGILLLPLLLVLALFLRLIIGFLLILFAIWFLGKIVLWLLEAIRPPKL